MAQTFRAQVRDLYFGDGPRARRFRYGLIVLDLATMSVFLIASLARDHRFIVAVDLVLGLMLIVELALRLYAEPNLRRALLRFTTLADAVVILSLLLPAAVDNLGFLRFVRALRLLRSYQLLRDLRTESAWFRLHEDIVQRTVNLGVFIFVVTSAVYVTQNRFNPQISTYIDALYFTITTLTTTGFGDITLQGPGGRLLAVIIMIVGVSLFLRLLQAIFRPNKVRFECPACALQVHDIDAVHCKHCGLVLKIPNEGVT